jgi:hypothetical protein
VAKEAKTLQMTMGIARRTTCTPWLLPIWYWSQKPTERDFPAEGDQYEKYQDVRDALQVRRLQAGNMTDQRVRQIVSGSISDNDIWAVYLYRILRRLHDNKDIHQWMRATQVRRTPSFTCLLR